MHHDVFFRTELLGWPWFVFGFEDEEVCSAKRSLNSYIGAYHRAAQRRWRYDEYHEQLKYVVANWPDIGTLERGEALVRVLTFRFISMRGLAKIIGCSEGLIRDYEIIGLLTDRYKQFLREGKRAGGAGRETQSSDLPTGHLLIFYMYLKQDEELARLYYGIILVGHGRVLLDKLPLKHQKRCFHTLSLGKWPTPFSGRISGIFK